MQGRGSKLSSKTREVPLCCPHAHHAGVGRALWYLSRRSTAKCGSGAPPVPEVRTHPRVRVVMHVTRLHRGWQQYLVACVFIGVHTSRMCISRRKRLPAVRIRTSVHLDAQHMLAQGGAQYGKGGARYGDFTISARTYSAELFCI
jgi:hypothetical protein